MKHDNGCLVSAVKFYPFIHTVIMAYSYKTSLNFGLVYIPVTLYSAVRENDIGFRMIDKKTMSRVRYVKTCEDCGGKPVRQEDIVKGFEYEDGKYVIFEESDFEKLKTKKDKNITIEKFVDVAEVDSIYFDKPYYVVPTGAEKAFAVLLSAMQDEGKAAIAKTILGTKETLIMIRAKDGQMLLNTLFFAEEITANANACRRQLSARSRARRSSRPRRRETAVFPISWRRSQRVWNLPKSPSRPSDVRQGRRRRNERLV